MDDEQELLSVFDDEADQWDDHHDRASTSAEVTEEHKPNVKDEKDVKDVKEEKDVPLSVGSDRVPFSTLCTLFERCTATTRVAAKKRFLQKLFHLYCPTDYFSLLRVLLPQVRCKTLQPSPSPSPSAAATASLHSPSAPPLTCFAQLDKERQTYGMKESNLAKYYIELLDISSESSDGRRLLNWRRPTGGDAVRHPVESS